MSCSESFSAKCDAVLKQYTKDHLVCPRCGADRYSMGFKSNMSQVLDDDGVFRNRDSVRCSCGWSGIVHGLVPHLEPLEKD